MVQSESHSNTDYTGRFAPSPTGPLHYGSLIAALASFLDARHNHGRWLLRIEDLDPPRESPEAPDQIMRQLEAFSLTWDGEVLYQSSRLANYEDALHALGDQTFQCTCTRKKTPQVYPGTCREASVHQTESHPVATRLRVPDDIVGIADRVCGQQTWSLSKDVGDFIIRRKDGLFAYQLAVVVDDIYQHVSHIVRGRDLLDSTPRQLALYRALDRNEPSYAHLPLVVDSHHIKLSKQAHARPVSTHEPLAVLKVALQQLGQPPVDDADTVEDLLAQAIQNWDIRAVTRAHELPEPAGIHGTSQT